jgi:hypothetical protein
MNTDILTWSVGDITITSVPESSTPTSPKFMFKGFDRTAVLELAEKATWLQPHFVDENGYLFRKFIVASLILAITELLLTHA